jgi:hypothetical protein
LPPTFLVQTLRIGSGSVFIPAAIEGSAGKRISNLTFRLISEIVNSNVIIVINVSFADMISNDMLKFIPEISHMNASVETFSQGMML